MAIDSDRFDAFVSYFEETGSDYAETIRDNLRRYSIETFVAHIERPNYVGNWEERINNVIANCRYFILLINIDTLGREQVIRECRRAYPTGVTQHPKFVIFREDLERVERKSEIFLGRTGIDISKENQQDFRTGPHLARLVSNLCQNRELVAVSAAPPEPAVVQVKYYSDSMVESNRTSVEKFRDKVFELGLWKNFEVKTFLFRSGNQNISWKVQFLYITLLERPVPQLAGLSSDNLRFIHLVRGIDHLSDILDQIASANEVTINNVTASLECVPNKLTYDSYYRFHPHGEIFGVKGAYYELLKSGNRSSELAEHQMDLVSEFEGSFDNFPDAVVNTLELPFWDGTYAPFVVVVAPILVEIATAEITNHRIQLSLPCSPLVDPTHLKLMLRGRNIKGRQVGAGILITGFRRSDDRNILLDSNMLLNDTITDLTLRLYYHNDLIQEEYFSKDQVTKRWVQP